MSPWSCAALGLHACTGSTSGWLQQRLTNSDFELYDRGWSIPVTAFSARYSWDVAHSGNQSMRTGIVSSSKNTYSYSDAWQLATIPRTPPAPPEYVDLS